MSTDKRAYPGDVVDVCRRPSQSSQTTPAVVHRRFGNGRLYVEYSNGQRRNISRDLVRGIRKHPERKDEAET